MSGSFSRFTRNSKPGCIEASYGLQAAQDQQEALLDAHNDAVLSGKPLQEDTQEPTGPAEAPDAGSGPSSDTGNVGALRPSGVGDNAQVVAC